MNLFDVAAEYKQQAELLSSLDLDEQTLNDTLESISGDLTVKATNLAYVQQNIERTADAIDAAIKQMRERSQGMRKRAERLKDYIKSGMELAGVTAIECPHFKLSIKQNPVSVDIFDEAMLPAIFMKQPPPVPDKEAIKAAIKAGEDVQGAKLVNKTRLDIK